MQSWRIFFAGVGGQGTLLATRLLGEAALASGLPVVVSEIHGMAQRGGVVESAVIIGARSSPTVAAGEADILMGFEPMETLRAVGVCAPGGLVITNISPVIPFTVARGAAKYPAVAEMVRLVQERVGRVIAYDALQLALQAGSGLAVNMVLLGTLIRHGNLPIAPGVIEGLLTTHTKKNFLEINRKAFLLGYQVENS